MERETLNKVWLRVENPEAARALADERQLRLLKPFVQQEHSLSSAAKHLGKAPSAMLYWIKKFMRLELIELARVEPRKGRGVKYYRAAAEGFIVPFEASAAPSLEALLYTTEEEEMKRFIHQTVRASPTLPGWSLGICRTAHGQVSVSLSPASDHDPDRIVAQALTPEFPALWASSSTLYLDYERAKALQRDLIGLFELYKDHGQRGPQAYLLRLGLTPLAPD